MSDLTDAGPLARRRIALLETREAERLGQMLREQGAEIVSCPAVAIVDAADPGPVLSWLGRFVAQPCDYLILLTGEGLIRLHGLAQRAGIEAGFAAALRQATPITRGPKPARALRAFGLSLGLRAEEPTTEGVVAVLTGLALRGRRVGVQLYPGASDRLASFLDGAGALPDPVTPYEYAARAPDASLAALIDRIISGEIDAIAFTSAPQARRLFEVAAARAQVDRLTEALRSTAVAAVGPVVADELRRHRVAPTIVPRNQYFMKPLVTAITAALTGQR